MNYGKIGEKISNSHKGKSISDETKKKLSLNTSNRRWINNGTINKYVYVEDLEKWLSSPNWKKGKINKRNRR